MSGAKTPYLTVKDAAAELGITDDGVRKLIRTRKLLGIKRSERNTIIPRPAFEAYQRKINGQSPAPRGRVRAVGSLDERWAAFEAENGLRPDIWLRQWIAEDREDLDGAQLSVSALGLLNEWRTKKAQQESIPVHVTVRAQATNA